MLILSLSGYFKGHLFPLAVLLFLYALIDVGFLLYMLLGICFFLNLMIWVVNCPSEYGTSSIFFLLLELCLDLCQMLFYVRYLLTSLIFSISLAPVKILTPTYAL